MEIEPADAAEPRADQHVGRIAGKARAGDAILHDVEGFHHHGRNAGPAAPSEKLPAQRVLAAEQAAQARSASASAAGVVAFVGAVARR